MIEMFEIIDYFKIYVDETNSKFKAKKINDILLKIKKLKH